MKSKILLQIMLLLLCSGCIRKLDLEVPREELDYTICTQDHLPKELQDMVETRKKSACSFVYSNSRYTYLVACYGRQEFSGYSISVEECSRGPGYLYLKTRLLGPSASEPVVCRKTWPYIVVRCPHSDEIAVIDL